MDTGFNLSGSLDGIKDSLSRIDVGISEITDILLTHHHIDHVGLLYNIKKNVDCSFSKSYRLLTRPDIILTDGDKISTENYSFKIILTPGHSPGHICLYETNFKFLIAGDHILPKITPNIIPYKEDSNPLYDYF
ncbi:MBL fold metallo-hydrolase [Candidatus Methanoliparum sp. LAM-1]|uniref:MBL fold metallo-hydrolase n=1 Tax=Candidatus Methanoliparum sp. LAM-1 TaxID=2874846 RepID=UPI00226CAEB2|nr:MBL fold metallo-hydrolase [Candidatus Methanoliparum sp. LAM-1]